MHKWDKTLQKSPCRRGFRGFAAWLPLLLHVNQVSFCINCGAGNPAGALFCLSCGRTLYHEPQKSKRRIGRRQLILVISILAAFAAVIVVVSITKTNESKLSTLAPDKTHDITTSRAEAVLTVVGTNRKGTLVSQGSGFILTTDGLAGSNYHVLKGAAEAFAECCNGRKFDVASIEGAHLDKDLVVFQLFEPGTRRKPERLPTRNSRILEGHLGGKQSDCHW
jgi:S1-C subfamily serine protease